MGRGRYIYINDDIDVRLQKEANRSKLVNELLREYFDKNDLLQMTEEELELEIKKNKIMNAAETKIKKLMNGK